jgi:hypothetical protein
VPSGPGRIGGDLVAEVYGAEAGDDGSPYVRHPIVPRQGENNLSPAARSGLGQTALVSVELELGLWSHWEGRLCPSSRNTAGGHWRPSC